METVEYNQIVHFIATDFKEFPDDIADGKKSQKKFFLRGKCIFKFLRHNKMNVLLYSCSQMTV